MAEVNETVDLDFSALSASLQVAKANFSNVVFRNMAETYVVGADVMCTYTISASMEANTRDWVGLYKVGWRSADNYIFYLWSPLPTNYVAGKEVENQVFFPAAKLPKDDGEFYQFCYVSSKGSICGASSPFQFRKSVSFSSSLDDLVEIEDENGELLIVKSKTTFLDEQLKKANEKCCVLKQDIQILESEKEMLTLAKQDAEQRLRSSRDEEISLRQQLTENKAEVQKLSDQISTLKTTISKMEQQLTTIVQEKSELQSRFIEAERNCVELRDELKSLQSGHDTLLGQVRTLQNEKELYQTHYSTSENAMRSEIAKNDELKASLGAEKVKSERLAEDVEKAKKELAEKIVEFEAQLEMQKETIAAHESRLSEAAAEIVSRGQQTKADAEQLGAMLEACQKLSMDLEVARTEAEGLKMQLNSLKAKHAEETANSERQLEEQMEKLSVMTQEKQALEAEVTKLHEKLDELAGLAGTDSALYAMQAAHAALKERYFRMEKQVAKQQAMIDRATEHTRELEQEVVDQRQEIKDLKERLLMGQDVYKEKFVECLKLQDQLAALQQGQGSQQQQQQLTPDVVRAESVSESIVINELQQQMTECAGELDRRADRLRQSEEELMMERESRAAAESRIRELEAELSVVQKVLSVAVRGPPSSSQSAVIVDAESLRSVPTLSTVVDRLFRQPVAAQPAGSLPPPLVPQRIYPSVDAVDSPVSVPVESFVPHDLMDSCIPDCGIRRPPTTIEPIERPPESLGQVLDACPLCPMVFTHDTPAVVRSAHIDSHYQPGVCPVCCRQFGEQELPHHVQGHFRD